MGRRVGRVGTGACRRRRWGMWGGSSAAVLSAGGKGKAQSVVRQAVNKPGMSRQVSLKSAHGSRVTPENACAGGNTKMRALGSGRRSLSWNQGTGQKWNSQMCVFSTSNVQQPGNTKWGSLYTQHSNVQKGNNNGGRYHLEPNVPQSPLEQIVPPTQQKECL